MSWLLLKLAQTDRLVKEGIFALKVVLVETKVVGAKRRCKLTINSGRDGPA